MYFFTLSIKITLIIIVMKNDKELITLGNTHYSAVFPVEFKYSSHLFLDALVNLQFEIEIFCENIFFYD